MRNIVIDHVSLMWCTEMRRAIYNDVADVTVQNTDHGGGPAIHLAVWKRRRAVPCRALSDIAVKGAQRSWANRIPFYRNLLSTCTYRNPQLYNVEHLDWVNNVIYNGANWSMHGNPRGLNYVGSVVRSGPDSTEGGKRLFLSDLDSDSSTRYFLNSVYLSDVLADDFAGDGSFAAGVQRSTPYGSGTTTFR